MKNQLKTVVLLGALSALLIGVGSAFGPGLFYLSIGLAVVMNLGAYFYSDKLVLCMSGAQPVSERDAPELHRMVEDLAQRAGIPKPRVFITPEEQPNAFATGRNPQNGVVAVTSGLMRLLDRRELRGVIAHEIAHIKNRDILVASVAAMFASAISSIANILTFSSLFGSSQDDEEGSGAGGLLMAFVAPIAATLVQLGISRSREYMADETGARIAGDAEGLALALLKLQRTAERIPADATPATASMYIVNPFAGLGSRLMAMFSTHPPVEERVRRLRALSGQQQGAHAPRVVGYRPF